MRPYSFFDKMIQDLACERCAVNGTLFAILIGRSARTSLRVGPQEVPESIPLREQFEGFIRVQFHPFLNANENLGWMKAVVLLEPR